MIAKMAKMMTMLNDQIPLPFWVPGRTAKIHPPHMTWMRLRCPLVTTSPAPDLKFPFFTSLMIS